MEQALNITNNLVRFNWQDSTTKHIGDRFDQNQNKMVATHPMIV